MGSQPTRKKGTKKRLKGEMEQAMRDSSDQFEKFTPDELNTAMMLVKTGNAAGLDGITTEMIQHFGPKTMSWVLSLFNKCVGTCRIPNGWRKTKVVALLKPGKDPKVPKSYRPISLSCILYKLYERMIMARMSLTVEENLTPDQAGFRPRRSTCGQLLNLTQYIEDGFEEKQITELNSACRIVTGQLRPTPLPLLYRTAGIAPPDIRRQTHESTEKHKQETDLGHPLFDHSYPRARLKTRKSFRTVESVQPDQAASHRFELWNT
ncbi:RNA-directed DNA polymerase from mobile element jockey-like [Elysia marginata]|uniref:RNA-directed DNA polymerase from mobile element jockey-like n=1 Tax=Elysia marginata TaxID=1093978 RepID=A0AAV4IVT5_9GAST|nr:RNA-directed DNA polymerase from mobile element jockey-like [Elysia marginata]